MIYYINIMDRKMFLTERPWIRNQRSNTVSLANGSSEWCGCLRRDGKPACKGSTFKGPFHVPRCPILGE